MSHQEEVGKRNIPTLINRKNQPYVKPSVIRPSDNYTFYGVTKTKAGEAEISLALKIILENGSQLIVHYHEINSPMRYDGATTIELNTSALSIIITGKNLADLIDYLAEHRLVWIKEPDSDFIQVANNEPEIEKIEVKEK